MTFQQLKKEEVFICSSLFIIMLIMVWLAFNANGTGDWGDAIYHYLYARYAFQHPENFLTHWAKPIYVLLTAPFAQFGFIGIKLFNIGMLIATIWITWLVGKQLNMKNAWLVVFLIITAPMASYQYLSGLTEPLFAFWLIVGIYGLVRDKYALAIVWLSFLPFVRSEGLIVFCVLPLYLLVKRKWYLLPLLAMGHIVYGIVGHFYYGDFWWIFNKMSYATLDGAYGAGRLWHFADKMHTVIGDFQPILLIMGLLTGAVTLIRYWLGKERFSKEKLWLVYGIAVAYFLAHTIFWYCGIFNSFGLMRVMIGVIPLFALIMLEGINAVIQLFPSYKKTLWTTSFLSVLVIALFWFLDKKIQYKYHFFQNAAQEGQNQLVEKYLLNYPDYTFYCDAIHLGLALEIDWFAPNAHRTIPQLFTGEPIPTKSLVLWDHIFTGGERKIPLEQLQKDPRFRLIECVETGTWENPKPKTCLFEFDSTYANSRVVLYKDYEQPPYPRSILDSTIVKTGKYSGLVNQKRPYSAGFTGYMNAFEQADTIQVGLWVYMTKEINAYNPIPQVVISFESKYKSFDYNAKGVFDDNDTTNQWKQITFQRPIPPRKLFDDKVKVYIWNPNTTPIYVDDMEVVWLGERSQ